MPDDNPIRRACRLCGSTVTKITGWLCAKCITKRRLLLADDPNAEQLRKRERQPIWDRLLTHRQIDEVTGCWLWTAFCDEQGYGKISNVWLGDKFITAMPVHRLVAHLKLGLDLSKPREEYGCHHCDNPPCFNPDHLFVGSPQDNTDDCKKKGRDRHPFGEENGGGRKLTADDVRVIRDRLSLGETQAAIAADYGVDYTMIGRILHGKAWTHVQ